MKRGNRFIYASFLIATVLPATEVLLRISGYQPGIYRQISGFQKVDSLILYKNFITDENGIYKFSKWASDSLIKYYNPSCGKIESPEVEAALYPVDNINFAVESFERITHPESFNSLRWKIKDCVGTQEWDSPIQVAYSNILVKQNDSLNEWSQAVKKYLQHPFNSEGFRSIEFKTSNTSRKRIFLIGDSFVYGMSASPFYNSFYDILLSKGYMVYAAGIPGTDPAQYAAVAAKYVRLLEPDKVIVCFYPGNDMMSYYRVPCQNEPHEHITNAGFFSSNINGKYYDAQDAYDYYLSQITVPQNGSLFNSLLGRTSAGSLLWGALKNGFSSLRSDSYPLIFPGASKTEQIKITKHYINALRETCSSAGIPSLFVVLPDANPPDKKDGFLVCDSMVMKQLFESGFYYPDSFEVKKHFSENDLHFNNCGHRLFASFLERLIVNTQDAYQDKKVEMQ